MVIEKFYREKYTIICGENCYFIKTQAFWTTPYLVSSIGGFLSTPPVFFSYFLVFNHKQPRRRWWYYMHGTSVFDARVNKICSFRIRTIHKWKKLLAYQKIYVKTLTENKALLWLDGAAWHSW
jgi:hypothetical protein